MVDPGGAAATLQGGPTMKGKTFRKRVDSDPHLIWRGAKPADYSDDAFVRVGHKQLGATLEISASGVSLLSRSDADLFFQFTREACDLEGVRRVMDQDIEFGLAWGEAAIERVLTGKYKGKTAPDPELEIDPDECALCGTPLDNTNRIGSDVSGAALDYCSPECIAKVHEGGEALDAPDADDDADSEGEEGGSEEGGEANEAEDE
jgi:hypothetical protein